MKLTKIILTIAIAYYPVCFIIETLIKFFIVM